MAETAKNLFDMALAELNKYSEDGVRIPEQDTIDLQMKAIPLIDLTHKQLFESCRLVETQTEPTKIETLEDSTEVNYKADIAIVYRLAANLAAYKKQNLVPYFESLFDEVKRICANKATVVAITDVYGFNTVT